MATRVQPVYSTIMQRILSLEAENPSNPFQTLVSISLLNPLDYNSQITPAKHQTNNWPSSSDVIKIAREAFGQFGTILLSFVLYFELFSCLCIFYVTLGDHLHQLFPMISVEKHMIYTSIVLTIPTALLRTPKLLSYLSVSFSFIAQSISSSIGLPYQSSIITHHCDRLWELWQQHS